MTPKTKKQAMDKLHAVLNKIGYPDKWRDYSTRRDHARRCLRQRRARQPVRSSSAQLDKIGKPVDKNEWGMSRPP